MRAGKLKSRIVIKRFSTQRRHGGEMVRSEMGSVRTHAEVRYDGGGREVSEGEIWYPQTVTFIVYRYIGSFVNFYDEVVYETRRYNIADIQPHPESNTLYLKCTLVNE